MKKIFYLILLATLTLTACGKKSGLTYPGEREKPKFDNVIDEK